MNASVRGRERSGGELLVEALLAHGVEMVFGVPGESYLPALDALFERSDRIRFVSCRHEGGAAFMAEACGKLTGRPGVCFVSRGPGATNAAIGVHTAWQDGTPFVLLVGQVGRDEAERDAFQEIDCRRMFSGMAKWAAQVERAERIPEMLSRAFHAAAAGRAGPVVLALPEDVLEERVRAPALEGYRRVQAHPRPSDLEKLCSMLAAAQRPMMLLGGGGWDARACEDIRAFAERYELPVACGYRCQDLLDNRHPNYVGDVATGLNPALEARIREADLLIVIGSRLDGWTTAGYTLVGIPRPRQRLVHVYPGAEELGRIYQADLPIHSGVAEFAAAARALARVAVRWTEHTHAAHEDYLAWTRPVAVPGPLNPSEVVHALRRLLPEDAIVACGAGTYIAWMHRFFQYTGFRTQLGPAAGAMGYGVPAAIAAKLLHPGRTVVSFSGDGCFLMNGQELATAARYGARVIHIVVNNRLYGTVRLNQEQRYPGRAIGSDLANPDFVALARAYGLHAERVRATAEFEPAFERVRAAPAGALIELELDPDVISPRATLTQIREQARARTRPPS